MVRLVNLDKETRNAKLDQFSKCVVPDSVERMLNVYENSGPAATEIEVFGLGAYSRVSFKAMLEIGIAGRYMVSRNTDNRRIVP